MKPKTVCQLGGKNGHMALQYYHRFDLTYIGNMRTQFSLVYNSSSFE